MDRCVAARKREEEKQRGDRKIRKNVQLNSRNDGGKRKQFNFCFGPDPKIVGLWRCSVPASPFGVLALDINYADELLCRSLTAQW